MQKKILILVIPISIIIAILIIGVMIFLGVPVYPFTQEYCGCHHMIPNYFFLLFGILLILAVIPISYYFSSKKMEKNLKEHVDFLSKLVNKNTKTQKNIKQKDKHSVLKFLSKNERKVLEKLIKDNGVVLQSQIGKMEDMTKLKAHRAVKSLEQKGIIKTQPHGKTKEIYLNKEFKKLLPDSV